MTLPYRYANWDNTGNHTDSHPSSPPFLISATSPTDIWRKPPSHNVFNAPLIFQGLPISSFARARVTLTGDWKTLYDQAGLAVILPPTTSLEKRRWIKTGIEMYEGKPFMSVVATDAWADWSLSPLSEADEKAGRVTVEVEREREESGAWGSVLKVSYVDGVSGKKMPVREVTWAFHGADEAEEMWVGVFVAKPTEDEREELMATVEKFEVEKRDGTKG